MFRDEDRENILRNIAKDIDLFNKFDFMDYSLLLVVAYNPRWVEDNGLQLNSEGVYLENHHQTVEQARMVTLSRKADYIREVQQSTAEDFYSKIQSIGEEDEIDAGTMQQSIRFEIVDPDV